MASFPPNPRPNRERAVAKARVAGAANLPEFVRRSVGCHSTKDPRFDRNGGRGVGFAALSRTPWGPRIQEDSSSRETNISTEQSEAQAPSRLSCSHGHEGGASNHQESACQGTKQAERLSPDPEPSSTRARFPRLFRLTRSRDFQRVFAKPLRSGGKEILVLARANHLGGARLGLAVSRKRVPKAVCRNRIKRVVRDSFRHHCRELGGLDIVVLARPGLARVGNAELRRVLAEHWRHLARADRKQESRQPPNFTDSR